VRYQVIPGETVEKQLSPGFVNDVNEYLQRPELRNSELASTAHTKTRKIIMNGNLTIKGNFDVDSLILSGWQDSL
jgi:hypothetical protein